ncbi:NaeI family type II restriction endonuclease [Streptomyces sp. JNUCC 63]
MTSDPAHPSSPSELKRLLDVLDRAGGHGATATEIAELIWLASHSGVPALPAEAGSGEPARDTSDSAPTDTAEPEAPAGVPEPMPPGRPGLLLSLRSETEPSDSAPYASLLTPLPPMLPHPLSLQRALRPLGRRVPSRRDMELDERRTAYRIARQGALPGTWLPVLRAKPERWLTLHLVYDAGPTMPIWRPLLRELHHIIGQTGAFRRIQLLELTHDGQLRQSPGGRPATLPPRDGRAVALILSDCSGPQWYAGAEAASNWYRTLDRWARTMPVAIVQPLPERLWRRSALPGTAGLLTARGPVAPNSALRFTPFDPAGEGTAGLSLPVLEPSARWFAHWAELVAGPPGAEVPGVVATLPTDPSVVPPEAGRSVPRVLSPEDAVLNFRAFASPQALRLAAHLAVAEPSVPLMRLVQAATEVRPEPQHLAEVVLSGLLTTAPGKPAAEGHYMFRPGVRDVLLRTLPRSAAARIGAVIQRYAGSRPGEFLVDVLTGGAGGTEGVRSRPRGEPLAVVPEETVQRLGRGPTEPADSGTLVAGRYRLHRQQHARARAALWRGTDERLGREVTLKLFRVPKRSKEAKSRFLADAERLASLNIHGLVRVGDFGFHDDRPYLVTDAVDGEDFGRLLNPTPGTPPMEVIRAVGGQLARTIAELHLNGLLHLDLSPSALVMRPDGRVLIIDPGLGAHSLAGIDSGEYRRNTLEPSGALPPFLPPEELFEVMADHRSDLYSLGCLLYAMVTGAPPAPGARAVRNAWVHGAPHPHPELPSALPPEFAALLRDLLATYPKDRPADANEVLDRLIGTRMEDEEIAAVYRAVRATDPDGNRMRRVLRDAIDTVLDGEQTGRYDLKDLFKTEKAHLGTLVESTIQREFRFADGDVMDFRIADVEVDCRFSLAFGQWMFPPEAMGHICLLAWANDDQSKWGVGLLRTDPEWLNSSKNRDLKRTLKAGHRDKIVWLWRDEELPENILLHMPEADREAIFENRSGQGRIIELFRRVQHRRIGRNAVRSVAQQKDYMKRIRGNDGARSVLRHEGIIIMGDYRSHRDIAFQLGLPVPEEGEFVSARVVPAVPGNGRPVAEIGGGSWSLAFPGDPQVTAPELPPTSAVDGRQ